MKHVYRNSVVDWYVAESPEHAAELARAHELSLGVEPDEIDGDFVAERLTFTVEPDDKVLVIHVENSRGHERAKAKTCGVWAAESEPGLLCTTEW